MSDQPAKLEWRDENVPVSTRFDDPYFSLENGLNETRHVFLSGNNLPARFGPGFHVAELGFGTGLNLLATWRAWDASDQNGKLRFTSFEAFPMSASEMERALRVFPDVDHYAERLVAAWSEDKSLRTLEGIDATVVLGDARVQLAKQSWQADAWYLDGFSPAKNPELWDEALLEEVGAHTKPLGTAATYTAAGFVRRNLAAAGFSVTRISGFGRKRHMTTAIKEAK